MERKNGCFNYSTAPGRLNHDYKNREVDGIKKLELHEKEMGD